MSAVTLEVPDDVSADDARLALAIGLWIEGRISQGRAASLCGLTRAAFIDELGKRRLPFTNITAEDLREELDAWPPRPSQTPRP